MSIRLSQVPEKYQAEMLEQIITWNPQEGVALDFKADVLLKQAFPWRMTPQGHDYWEAISEGRDPAVENSVVSKALNQSLLEILVEEAERRGFAVGVMTKYGRIVDDFEHELQSNGDFYYRNVKVYKDGEWIKAGEEQDEDSNDEAAIHALFAALATAIGGRSSSPFSNPGLN
jgi:hypothetical protein